MIVYKCNGKAPCSIAPNGKKNKFCRYDQDNYQKGCYLTTDPKYAIDKNKPIEMFTDLANSYIYHKKDTQK